MPELSPPISLSQRLLELIDQSVKDDTFVRLVLSGGGASEGPDQPHRVVVRWIVLQEARVFSLTFRYAKRDETRNLTSREFHNWLNAQFKTGFSNALLCTSAKDWQWIRSAPDSFRLIPHPPSTRSVPPRAHNVAKPSLLDASAVPWLQALQILGADGKLRASMAGKHRQVHRYLEILDQHLGPLLSEQKSLNVLDVGSGKGYLTFAIWHWLQKAGGARSVVRGIEARRDLVEKTNQGVTTVGAVGLQFECGEIATLPPGKLDVLVALHACNTATDDAILYGAASGAAAVVIAPCCHQEIRPLISDPTVLSPILSQGIFKERLAEWLTDGLRTLYLQAAGYRVTAIEFVGAEHTPKNLLIIGILDMDPVARQSGREAVKELKQFFGISEHRLDRLLEVTS